MASGSGDTTRPLQTAQPERAALEGAFRPAGDLAQQTIAARSAARRSRRWTSSPVFWATGRRRWTAWLCPARGKSDVHLAAYKPHCRERLNESLHIKTLSRGN